MPSLQEIQAQVFGGVTSAAILNFFMWIGVIVLLVAAGGGFIWWSYNRKLFSKEVTDFEIINGEYVPVRKDRAKGLRLGSGGFEIIYLQKAKRYRLGYGARIGKNHYYYFIGADGYPYNGKISSELTSDGKIPIIVTNPTARAQYTALERHVEQLFGEKKNFWQEYGYWILTGAYMMITGVILWLIMKEFSTISGNMVPLIDKEGELIDKVNKLLVVAANQCNGVAG